MRCLRRWPLLPAALFAASAGVAAVRAAAQGPWPSAEEIVLSGTRDGTIFYERVTFTCGGRLINGWAMLYPAAERRVYDHVVERVARSYRAGARNCG